MLFHIRAPNSSLTDGLGSDGKEGGRWRCRAGW